MRLSGYQNKPKSTKKAAVDFSDPLKSLLDDRIPEKWWVKADQDRETHTPLHKKDPVYRKIAAEGLLLGSNRRQGSINYIKIYIKTL